MSQRELSARLKRGKNFVQVVEAGERLLSVCEFIDYARALRADPLEMFGSLLESQDAR